MRILTMPGKAGLQRVTTPADIRPTLKAMLSHPHYAGDTVGEFIDALLRMTTRDQLLGSIEFGVACHGTGRIRVEFDEHGAIEIREVVSHAS